MGLKQVAVRAIALDREREFPVVLMGEEEDDEMLPIWIGAAEATAIYSVLAGSAFERPMTHDLMKLIIEELGASVSAIEITGIHSDTYFARIVLKREEDLFYLDARPSDSIALALRTGAPIFVDEELYDRYKRKMAIGGGKGEGAAGLDEIDPDDLAGPDR